MKHLLFTVIITLAAATVQAGQLTLNWDPITEPVRTYTLYYGETPDTLDQKIEVGDVTRYTVQGLTAGKTYFFRVSGTTLEEVETALSNGAFGAAKLDPPTRLHVYEDIQTAEEAP